MIITNEMLLSVFILANILVGAHYLIVAPPDLMKNMDKSVSNKEKIPVVLNELVRIRMRRSSSLVLALLAMAMVIALAISNLTSDSGSVFLNSADYNFMPSMFILLGFASLNRIYFSVATKRYDAGLTFLDFLDDDEGSVAAALEIEIEKNRPTKSQ